MTTCDFDSVYRKHFPFWESLTESDRQLLCANTREVSYKKGEAIKDGDGCTGAVFVLSGCVRVYILSDEGKEVTLYRLFPGDVCLLSASCVVQAITFDVFVEATEDSNCYVLNPKAFSDVSDRNTDMKIYALELAVERFSDVMWTMQQILFFSFDKRLAIFLYEELIKNGPIIRYSHMEIAKYLGSAREVVSRMLKYFEKDGIVLVSRKEIEIIDKKKLMEANENPERHPDLVVRVTGFTAYFASLSPQFRQLVVDRFLQGI